MERKLNEQWIEVIDGKKHMLKAVPSVDIGSCTACDFEGQESKCAGFPNSVCGSNSNSFIIKDLGILNEDGCLPAPWDETKYPKITVLFGNVYNIEVMEGFWFMQVRGDTLEKAVERWNRRA